MASRPARAVALLCTAQLCLSRYSVVDVPAHKRWHYVDQFVFDTTSRDSTNGWQNRSSPPSIKYWVESPKLNHTYRVAFYDDETFSWPSVYYKSTSDEIWARKPQAVCEDISRGCDGKDCWGCTMKACYQPDPLAAQCRKSDDRGQCEYSNPALYLDGNSSGLCPDGEPVCGSPGRPSIFYPRQSTRPRFWYVVVVNCGLEEATGVRVHVESLNPGGWWRRQFGIDRQGLLEMYTLYVILGSALYVAYAIALWRDQRQQGDGSYLHFVLKWWAATATIQLVAFVFLWGHYLSYAHDGIGHPSVMWTAEGLRCLSALMFMTLLLVFSTGFTVVGVQYSTPLLQPLRQVRRLIAVVFAVLLVFNIVMYCLTAKAMKQDPADVPHDNPYQTWAGIFLASARLPIAAFYVHNLGGAMRRSPEMLSFYRLWGGCFLAYILFLPVAMLLAHVVSPWVMFRAVQCSVDTVTMAAFCQMGALLWPGHRAQGALAKTYTVADTGATHMPLGDHGSALPDRGPNRSFLGPSLATGPLPQDEEEMMVQNIPLDSD